ncbi:MAG: hypothetical protein ACE5QF_05370 [Thermoplasmata archaeon]
MPYFDGFYRQALAHLDRRKETDPSISDLLRRYDGRRLHLVVRGDAGYLFSVSSGAVSYETDPERPPDDIYVEMDFAQARKFIEERRFGLFDLLSIRFRNINSKDIEFVRALFHS